MGEETIVEESVSKLPMARERFSLYLRAPHWIIERETSIKKVKKLNNRIIEVRFPRQKSAHFCYVDFASAEDRDKAYKELRTIPDEQKILITKMTKDRPTQLEKRIEKVQKKREAKIEVTTLLKGVSEREARDAKARSSSVSSKVSIINVPRNTIINDIKSVFPKAINISLDYPEQKNSPGKALLTYATPGDAVIESKRSVFLNDAELKLRIELNQDSNKTNASKRRGRNKAAVRYFDKKEGENKPIKKEKMDKNEIEPKNKQPRKKLQKNGNAKKSGHNQKAAGGEKKPVGKRGKKGAPKKNDEIKIYN